MAWCPFAVHKPINKSRGWITPRVIIDHTAVSSASSLFGYFSSVAVDSHFYIDSTGRIEQYVDTARVAYANRYANDFAVSIETWDGANPIANPWNAPMLDSLMRLHEWIRQAHSTIPRRRCDGPYGAGLGYHSMWGAPSAWTPSAGKTCPAATRINQWNNVLLPHFINGIPGGGGSTPPAPTHDELLLEDSMKELAPTDTPELAHLGLPGLASTDLLFNRAWQGYTVHSVKLIRRTDGNIVWGNWHPEQACDAAKPHKIPLNAADVFAEVLYTAPLARDEDGNVLPKQNPLIVTVAKG